MSKDVIVNSTIKQSNVSEQTPPEWNLNPPDKRCPSINKDGIQCGLPINHKERFGVSRHSNGLQHRSWD